MLFSSERFNPERNSKRFCDALQLWGSEFYILTSKIRQILLHHGINPATLRPWKTRNPVYLELSEIKPKHKVSLSKFNITLRITIQSQYAATQDG